MSRFTETPKDLLGEIERLRAAYDDAVTRQKARRHAIIEECAQVVEAKEDLGGNVYLAAVIRSLKEKP